MYVFRKNAQSNDLALLYNWPVSTGRERIEHNSQGLRLPSHTPVGYYELDPGRSYEHHFSLEWQQPMPYAMFFNWVKDGQSTGLAIHGATGRRRRPAGFARERGMRAPRTWGSPHIVHPDSRTISRSRATFCDRRAQRNDEQ